MNDEMTCSSSCDVCSHIAFSSAPFVTVQEESHEALVVPVLALVYNIVKDYLHLQMVAITI